jgi:hypothetical protein
LLCCMFLFCCINSLCAYAERFRTAANSVLPVCFCPCSTAAFAFRTSVIGVSLTRSAPCFCNKPLVICTQVQQQGKTMLSRTWTANPTLLVLLLLASSDAHELDVLSWKGKPAGSATLLLGLLLCWCAHNAACAAAAATPCKHPGTLQPAITSQAAAASLCQQEHTYSACCGKHTASCSTTAVEATARLLWEGLWVGYNCLHAARASTAMSRLHTDNIIDSPPLPRCRQQGPWTSLHPVLS